jgi:hypothetical protein
VAIYGDQLMLDLRDADPGRMTRESVASFLHHLCARLDLEPQALLIDADPEPVPSDADARTYGLTAVQVIKTSSVVVHCLPALGSVFVDVFVCREFHDAKLGLWIAAWFRGRILGEAWHKRHC